MRAHSSLSRSQDSSRWSRSPGVGAVIVYEDDIEKANSLSMLSAFGIDMRLASSVHTLGAEDWTVLVGVEEWR